MLEASGSHWELPGVSGKPFSKVLASVLGSPILLLRNCSFESFRGFYGGDPSGRSNLLPLRILARLIDLVVELIFEYLILYAVSVSYCDFGVVREFSALFSILMSVGFKLLNT